MRVLVARRVLPPAPRAGPPASGPIARRWPPAPLGPSSGYSSSIAPCHRWPPLTAGDLGAVRARPSPSPPAPSSTASPSTTSPTCHRHARWSYATWGAGRAPALARAWPAIPQRFRFDLIHAHYAIPAGDAARRPRRPPTPLLVSGARGRHLRSPGDDRSISATLPARAAGSRQQRRDGPALRSPRCGPACGWSIWAPTPPGRAGVSLSGPTLVTVGNLIARKRHADVIAALARAARPPSRPGLRDRRRRSRARAPVRARRPSRGRGAGSAAGRLGHDEAIAVGRSGSLFVLPSLDEAFGVSYSRRWRPGSRRSACRGQDGPDEIAAAGGGSSWCAAATWQRSRVSSMRCSLTTLAAGARSGGARERRAQLHLGGLRDGDAGRLPRGAGPVPPGRAHRRARVEMPTGRSANSL